MLTIAVLIGYAALVILVGRRLLAGGHKGGAAIYAVTLIYCAYLSHAALSGEKAMTPTGLYMIIFRPFGQWLDALLGGT